MAIIVNSSVDSREHQYVNVVFPSALRREFSYRIDCDAGQVLQPGQRVIVTLRGKPTVAFISAVGVQPPDQIRIQTVTELVDSQPVIPVDMFQFLKRLAAYYLAPLGKVLAAAIPREYQLQQKRMLAPNPEGNPDQVPAPYRELYAAIRKAEAVLLSKIRRSFSRDLCNAAIPALKRLALIEESVDFARPKPGGTFIRYAELNPDHPAAATQIEALQKRAPRQWEIMQKLQQLSAGLQISGRRDISRSAVEALLKRGWIRIREADVTTARLWSDFAQRRKTVTLTDEQKEAYEAVAVSIRNAKYNAYLLQGVTGSGKTEVYIRLIHTALEIGKTAIILVPEITLTTHLASRFRGEFQEKITIWHSQLSPAQRSHIWNGIRNGDSQIVIGARSALFLPLPSLGLIIVDEEQDSSFKQRGNEPRYHARDAALLRAQCSQATVVLGSATPSLESVYNAATQKIERLQLHRRYSEAPHPQIHLVDMKKEWQKASSIDNPLSELLTTKIREKLDRREQVLLLQNRRGYSNFLLCGDCGYVPSCPNCDISFTYHKKTNRLLCHYCNTESIPPAQCPRCGNNRFLFPGYGTQRIESQVSELFPDAEIRRLDMDMVQKRGYLPTVMRQFGEGEIDILLGTQMIAKGLDFPNITLVGILNADIGLFMPDFRARERVFHLLYQVAGRTGRGKEQGQVIVQTFNPDDLTIRLALQQNLSKFTNTELSERNPLNYPPFSRMALILISDLKQSRAREAAQSVYTFLRRRHKQIQILGPSEAPIARIKNRFRFLLILKSRKDHDPNGSQLRHLLRALLQSRLYESLHKNVRISIDIDPLDMI